MGDDELPIDILPDEGDVPGPIDLPPEVGPTFDPIGDPTGAFDPGGTPDLPDFTFGSPDAQDFGVFSSPDLTGPTMGMDMDAIKNMAATSPQMQQDYDNFALQMENANHQAAALPSYVGVQTDSQGNMQVVDTRTGQQINKQTNPTLWEQTQKAMAPIAAFAASSLGKAALAAGLGAATMGLSSAIVGGSPTFKVPNFQTPQAAVVPRVTAANAYAPVAPPNAQDLQWSALPASPQQSVVNAQAGSATPGSATAGMASQLPQSVAAQRATAAAVASPEGQGNIQSAVGGALKGQANVGEFLANQSGISLENQDLTKKIAQNVRTGAYGNLVDAMGKPLPIEDAIDAGLSNEIQRVLSGQYSNPDLENRIKQSDVAFEQDMVNRLGPGWSTSTAGIQAKEQHDLYNSSVRDQDQKQTLASLSSLEQQRRQFNVTNPQQYQAQSIAQNTPLATIGLSSPEITEIGTNLDKIASVPGLADQPGANQVAVSNAGNETGASIATGNMATSASIYSGQMATSVSMANSKAANDAGMVAYQAAVAQGAREDQAQIAFNTAYQKALNDAAAQANQNNFNAQQTQANFENNAALAGSELQFKAQQQAAAAKFGADTAEQTAQSKAIGSIVGAVGSAVGAPTVNPTTPSVVVNVPPAVTPPPVTPPPVTPPPVNSVVQSVAA